MHFLAPQGLRDASGRQLAYELQCSGKTFRVYGRPYDPNEAGFSQVEASAEFDGRSLDFGVYPYLNAASSTLFDLKTIVSGGYGRSINAYYGMRVSSGLMNLYMQTSTFSEEDYKTLSGCLMQKYAEITQTLRSTPINNEVFILGNVPGKIPNPNLVSLTYGSEPAAKEFYDDRINEYVKGLGIQASLVVLDNGFINIKYKEQPPSPYADKDGFSEDLLGFLILGKTSSSIEIKPEALDTFSLKKWVDILKAARDKEGRSLAAVFAVGDIKEANKDAYQEFEYSGN